MIIMDGVYTRDIDDLLKGLDTSAQTGLSEEEVILRQNKYGKNLLQEFTKESWVKLLLRQFLSPMIYLLGFAAFISLFMKEYLDGAAIIIVILINGLIGFFTEYRAEKSLDALRLMTSPSSKVLRDGQIVMIKSEDLVPGDIILLEAGDIVPADARLFQARNLMVNEASLTGESLPVDKDINILPKETNLPDRKNCVHAGTSVVKGTGRAVVFAIAMETEFGKIGEMLQTVSSGATPLEERLARFSRFLIYATMAIALAVITLGIFQGRGLIHMIETGIALAVAAVPEGLPFVATMTLAIGVRRMAALNALVRNLSSVETLGSTTVICTDKTGTLTMNDMSVRSIEMTGHKNSMELLIRTAAVCNDGELPSGDASGIGDPMDVALLRYLFQRGYDYRDIRSSFPRIDEEPFDSATKKMLTYHDEGIAMKGAPEVVIDCAASIMTADGEVVGLDDQIRNGWKEKVRTLASRGMRTLAFAWGDSVDKMIFLGLAGIDDPPRPEVPEAVKKCSEAGIHVVMITGDHLVTANAIASEVGILHDRHDDSIQGMDLDKLQEKELPAKIRRVAVVARVSPENKLQIVKGLQQNGEVVAMTGDGVNDAVALKQADVGISMGIQGTEVSKEASDIILQDDRFLTIVNAVSEGRRIFDNIRKAILFLLCCNLSEVLTVFLSILLRLPSVLLPLQILWINLATDVIPALSLALDPAEPDLMTRLPKNRDEEIITNPQKMKIMIYGSLMTTGVLAVYLWSLANHTGDFSRATEMGFHTLVISQLLFVINVRKHSILYNPSQLWTNPWLIIGVLLSLGLQVLITYIPVFQMVLKIVPLGPGEWVVILIGALFPTSIAQLNKIIGERRR